MFYNTTPLFLIQETYKKCSILFKTTEGENFNRRNTLSISRIKIWVWRPAEAGGEKDSFRSDTTYYREANYSGLFIIFFQTTKGKLKYEIRQLLYRHPFFGVIP